VLPWQYSPRPLGDNDVEIKISHCGICHSDIHQIDSGWAEATYPLVPGHEIVGHVTAVGSKASHKVGDRVGVGAQIYSCPDSQCGPCKKGNEMHCTKRVYTYNDRYADRAITYGGYSEHVRVDSKWVFGIPEGLASDLAAPMLCAGITVYAPLKHYGIGPGKQIAVLGIGGLGHLAIQFASKMGAHVTALSTSTKKKDDALALGASDFIVVSDAPAMKAAADRFDFILSTVSDNLDYAELFSIMAPWGNFVMVGLPEKPLQFTAGKVVGKNLSYTGSTLSPNRFYSEMLEFAAKHGVKTWVHNLPMKEANDGIKLVREGKVRYRVVLHN